MNLKKIMMYLLVAFAVFFVVQSPGEAAKLVKTTGETAGEWFTAAAESLSKFVKSLV